MVATLLPLIPKTGTQRVFVSRKGSSGSMAGKYVPDNLVALQWQLDLKELTPGVDNSEIHWYNAGEAPLDLIKQASIEVYAHFGMEKADVKIKVT